MIINGRSSLQFQRHVHALYPTLTLDLSSRHVASLGNAYTFCFSACGIKWVLLRFSILENANEN